MAAEAGTSLKTAFTSYSQGDIGGALKSAMGLVKTATGSSQKAEKYARATRTSPADVVRASYHLFSPRVTDNGATTLDLLEWV